MVISQWSLVRWGTSEPEFFELKELLEFCELLNFENSDSDKFTTEHSKSPDTSSDIPPQSYSIKAW